MKSLRKHKISWPQLGALQFAAEGPLHVGGMDPMPMSPRTPKSLADRGLLKLVDGGYFFWEYELTQEGREVLAEIEEERKSLAKPEEEWEPLPDYDFGLQK